MGCRRNKPQPAAREEGQEEVPAREGGAAEQGGGLGVEEEVDQVLGEEGGLPYSLGTRGEVGESRVPVCGRDDPLSSNI